MSPRILTAICRGAALWVAPLFFLLACAASESPPPAAGDASFAPPPTRMVVAVPDNFGQTPAAGSNPAPVTMGPEGLIVRDAGAARDTSVAIRLDTNPPPLGMPLPPGSCDPIKQDCTVGRACYPGGLCKVIGGYSEGSPCQSHEQCDRALLCAPVLGGTCQRICDTQTPKCGGKLQCVPAGQANVGYCAP